GLKVQNQRFQQGATVARINQGAARINVSRQGLRLRQVQNDRNFQLGLTRVGISEAGLRLRAAQLEAKRREKAKAGGFTQTQRVQLRKLAGRIANDAWNGVPTIQTDAAGNAQHGTTHHSYQEAI